jgi:triosephosphate isomerase
MADERPVIIAGNWKMHKTRSEAQALAQEIKAGLAGEANLPEVVLCPAFTSLDTVVEAVSGSKISVGAQNMDHRDAGAYTGEISPLMLTDLKVTHVVIGHSERRQYFGETNSSVNLKLKAALHHGLVPIVCVGESLDEREHNLTDSVISRQVAAALTDIDPAQLDTLVLAYEPVWAIGTGKVCQSVEANRVCQLIRNTVRNLYNRRDVAPGLAVLYGGSVKPDNIVELLGQADIDGALVGGASLAAADFLALVRAGQKRVALAAARS